MNLGLAKNILEVQSNNNKITKQKPNLLSFKSLCSNAGQISKKKFTVAVMCKTTIGSNAKCLFKFGSFLYFCSLVSSTCLSHFILFFVLVEKCLFEFNVKHLSFLL